VPVAAFQKIDKKVPGYSRWVVLVMGFLATCLISPYEYVWSSVSPLFSERFGWPIDKIGLIFSFYVIFSSGAALPTGVFRDKYGPRLLTMLAGVVAAIGLYSLSASSYNVILILFGILGSLASGVVYSNTVNISNKWFPDRRGLTVGLITAAFSWGSIPFILWIRGSATITTYPQIISKMALIAGAIIVVCGYFLNDPPKGWGLPGLTTIEKRIRRPSERQFTLRETIRTWQFWALFLSFLLIAAVGLMTVSNIVRYASELGFTAVVATSVAGGLAFTAGLGRPIIGAISDRLRRREDAIILSSILFGLLTLGIYAFGVIHSSIGFLICTFASIFSWGSLYGVFPAICGDYYGEVYAASNYGLLYLAKLGGGLYGGYLSALIITRYGFGASFVIGGVMAIVAGLIVMFPKYKPPV
jgi:OFA family oxalate/formate antiporter-like MFS transporter